MRNQSVKRVLSRTPQKVKDLIKKLGGAILKKEV